DVAVGGLVTERDPQRIVVVVGLLGGGQDVGQRLADVVHVGGTVPADVVQEPGRRERRGRHRGAGAHSDAPAGVDGVGVEQRHGQVAGVGTAQLIPVDQGGPGEQHGRV